MSLHPGVLCPGLSLIAVKHVAVLCHGMVHLDWVLKAVLACAPLGRWLSQVGEQVVGDSVVDNGPHSANCSHDTDDCVDACHQQGKPLPAHHHCASAPGLNIAVYNTPLKTATSTYSPTSPKQLDMVDSRSDHIASERNSHLGPFGL